MRALVAHGPETRTSDEIRDPTLPAGTDAIVRVDAVTTCGTDSAGRGLGHEAVGTVEAVGSGVKTIEVGDRVLVSCIPPSGTRTPTERVLVPFADTSTYKVPDGVTDGQMLTLVTFLRRTPSSASSLFTRPSAAAPAR